MSAVEQSDETALMFSIGAYEPQELSAAARVCLAEGRLDDAEALLRAWVLKQPNEPEARYALAAVLAVLGRHNEAEVCLADAAGSYARFQIGQLNSQLLAPETPAATLFDGAQVLYSAHQLTAASYLFQKVLDQLPDQTEVYANLGLTMLHQGRTEQAGAAFDTIIKRKGSAPGYHGFLYLVRSFQQVGPQTLYNEGRRWSRLCEATVHPRLQRLPRRNGRLRIGYFSYIFNRHQLTHFFLPILEHHDKDRFEIFCYSQTDPTDDVGHAAAACSVFRNVSGLSDDAFADLVEADEIDILVDLWGHAVGARLLTFARRPAPVQVSWLNNINTTGLTTFDHVLHADGYRTPEDQKWFSEPIFSIGPVIAPYRLFDSSGPSGRTPALEGNPFTFASAAHPAKLNLEVVRIWAEILRRSPGSQLQLRYSYYEDPGLRLKIAALFEAFGVSPERIVFPPFLKGEAFRRELQKVDLVLDPFPFQGMTTTVDALAIGLPVLALDGDYLALRIAGAAIRACGLDELVVKDTDAYIDKAVAFTRDIDGLQRLREKVEPAFAASPFREEAVFTRRLEAAYISMVEAKLAAGST